LLGHIYYESFGCHDHKDNKQERSANDALLLLSAHYRCTNNPYFIAKIKEIWKSISLYEVKWTADVWNMALAKFAYDDEELNEEDATKVLNNFMVGLSHTLSLTYLSTPEKKHIIYIANISTDYLV
jgi:hypothetical protein